MAVRLFDHSEHQSARLTVLAGAPRRRRDVRRARQRWLFFASLALSLPFVAAVIVLGVTH
ncbi:MAG TPA: hypothetical protein VLS91_05355 [Acidimicrobiales bacterium]|nr:hypothetical protein [Acidimicrobiales bacterium]